MQRGDDGEGDRHRDGMRAGDGKRAETREQRLDQARQRRLADPAKRERRDGDAELAGGEIGVQSIHGPL